MYRGCQSGWPVLARDVWSHIGEESVDCLASKVEAARGNTIVTGGAGGVIGVTGVPGANCLVTGDKGVIGAIGIVQYSCPEVPTLCPGHYVYWGLGVILEHLEQYVNQNCGSRGAPEGGIITEEGDHKSEVGDVFDCLVFK